MAVIHYEDASAPLDEKDFQIIKKAAIERGGFAGATIVETLSKFGVTDSDIDKLDTIISAYDQRSSLSRSDAQNAFIICCLASAALGDEELQTCTGFERDEFYGTIRRLYHLFQVPHPPLDQKLIEAFEKLSPTNK